MIRNIIIVAIILLMGACNLALGQQLPQIEKIRDQFFAFDKSKNAALNLYKSLEFADLSRNPVMLAYRGASSAASAGCVSGVMSKLEYFNHGKSELEKAISIKPLDAEIRFLRLATQVNAPGFLGYSGDIKTDKVIIIKTLSLVQANHPNAYLYQRICQFLLSYVKLEASEKNTVKQLVIKFTSTK